MIKQTNRTIGTAIAMALLTCWNLPVRGEMAQDMRAPQITLGAPVVVSQAPVGMRDWGPWQFPFIQRLADGRLQIGYWLGADSATAYGDPPGVAISADNGNTWKVESMDPFPPDWRLKSLTLANGDRLCQIMLRSRKLAEIQDTLPPPFTTRIAGYGNTETMYLADKMPGELAGWRFARLAKGSTQWVEETAKVNIPGAVRAETGGVLVLPWIERIKIAPDGTLWGVGFPPPVRVVNGTLQKHNAVPFLHSTDQGRTWDLLSEIPYQPDANADKFADQREGFTEPEFAFLPDRSILCLTRTTDGKGVGPLYTARSTDNGKTWSKPSVFDDFGVWPVLLTLDNGITLASYGRPGLYVRATRHPAGKSWGDKATVVRPGEVGQETCSYSDLVALDQNSVLIVYSDFNYPDEQGRPRKSILVRRITLTDGSPVDCVEQTH